MSRLPLMAGNWKSNLNHHEAVVLVQKLAWTLQDKGYDPSKSEVVVVPPFTDIRSVQTLVDGDRLPIKYGAQDISEHDGGAFTGEVSGAMLSKLGCSYVVVGHSERRQFHGEDDALVSRKVRAALNNELIPIVCVGEALEVRQAGEHVSYTLAQVDGALAHLTAEEIAKIVIAYEPVWAIGTGEVATADDAQEVCAAIRDRIIGTTSTEVGESTRILYGGSVKASNVAALMSRPDVDGALVGGASLDAEEFAAIARFYDLPTLSDS